MSLRSLGERINWAAAALWATKRRRYLTHLIVIMAIFGMIIWRTLPGGNIAKRCVDHQSMTVVAPGDCSDENSVYVWYYGGTGTRLGSRADDGSVTPPEDDGSDDGSNDNGDDGSDDGGDDGGSDDGGGDGGDGGGDGGGGDG